jgi:shikimate dehydrogenase
MISGTTTLIAHIGYPTEAFKAPLIYNPWFEHSIEVRVGSKAPDGYGIVVNATLMGNRWHGAGTLVRDH